MLSNFKKEILVQFIRKNFWTLPRESPWGNTQREQKEGLEFGDEEYKEIDDYCKKIGIEWFASAWDLNSQKFLRKFNCKFNKVASAMLGNIPLVKMIAEERKKPLFLPACPH